ncbi:hypothetical protein [Curtobacterium sp. MCSS17_015]|uniref:hypothetical protein n=1 Tax=Curtobacterium sp. MCSS17_015 TaxID=2175666 RepID=UPI000DA8695D|nr:hypothetical protein [Curtobacterium sp. MCSS17_015]WIB25432.1 hypothetical protein DEJ18_10220 [Curtobacterium sp. MCSS17_015]
MSILTITLPGLEVLGRPLDGSPPDGVYLGPDGFEGWDDTPDMRRETVQRVAAAGDFDATGYADARVVSLSGLIVSPSEARTQYWTERLTGVLSGGTTEKITVRRNGTVRFASGGLVKTKVVTRARARHVADWQMQLWFPNPFKYGDENHVQSDDVGFAVVSHYGNAAASPLLVVTGSAPGWDVAARGMRVSVTRALQPGQKHVYDLRTGLLTINGSPAPAGSLDEADTWTVPAGDAIGHRLQVGSGTGTLDVYTPDTYI